MLAYGHELNMCKMKALAVAYKLVSDLVVGVPAVFVVRILFPGAQVNFVDIHGGVEVLCTAVHPITVIKCVGVQIAYHRGKIRSQLHAETVGVTMLPGFAV